MRTPISCRIHGPMTDSFKWRQSMNEARAESPLLIVFTDLSRFYLQSKRFTDTQMADTLDAC